MEGIDLSAIVSGKRTRKVLHSQDYSFAGAFDDDSVSDDGKPSRKAAPKKAGARAKECPGCGARVGLSIKECTYCDHLFTSKSSLGPQTQVVQIEESQGIRERFHFEPEREDDGSLLITAIIGRRPRSGATVFSRAYHFRSEQSAVDEKYEHEYLVKYKDMSYRQCQWLSANEIDAMSIKSKTSLSRYLTKIDKGDANAQEDGEIDPSWVEVERVLDVREEEVSEVVDETQQQRPVEEEATEGADIAPPVSKSREQVLSLASRSSFASQSSAMEESSEESSSEEEDGAKIKTNISIFQHEVRIRKMLERIWDDPFAASFVDPVDTNLFEDYLDIVEEPMCLSTVKARLENGEYRRYNMHQKFMQDMRLIWKNCKVYNLYKSQIWHSAHTLSMMSERLYQAWVASYSDGSIEMKEPIGRPWEQTCRKCQKDSDEPHVILCDHCDTSFHIYCLNPPLETIPEGAWVCNRCVRWIERTGSKLLTASAEDEARAMAESAGIRKVVQVRKKKYLVKWRGLSYRECTWETAASIGDDSVIAEYHKLNDAPPDEPPLTQAELDAELRKDRAKPLEMAKSSGYYYNPAYDVDAEVYAQIRAMHFLKWNMVPPEALIKECGPECFAYAYGHRSDLMLPQKVSEKIDTIRSGAITLAGGSTTKTALLQSPAAANESADRLTRCEFASGFSPERDEVIRMLGSMVNSVARNGVMLPVRSSRPLLPPRDKCPSEIEICWPSRPDGKLFFRIANYYGRVSVLGFHKLPNNKLNPLATRLKQGDILTGINGVAISHLAFNDVLKLLTTTNTPYLHLRFLRTMDRSGPEGVKERAALDARRKAAALANGLPAVDDGEPDDPEQDVVQRYLNRKRVTDITYNAPILRSLYQGVYPAGEGQWQSSFYRNHEEEVVGVFDTELEAAKARDAELRKMMNDKKKKGDLTAAKLTFDTDHATLLPASLSLFRVVTAEREQRLKVEANIASSSARTVSPSAKSPSPSKRHAPVEVAMEVAGSGDDDDASDEGSNYSEEEKPATKKAAAAEKVATEKAAAAMNVTPSKVKPPASGNLRTPEAGAGHTTSSAATVELDLQSLDSYDSDSENNSVSDDSESIDENSSDDEWVEDDNGDWKPASDVIAPIDGPITRLLRAVNEADMAPIRKDWEKYIYEDYSLTRPKAEDNEATEKKPIYIGPSNSKQVEQIDMATGEVVQTWGSVTHAARAMGCSTTLIHECLGGKKESAGGFKWKESTVQQEQALQDVLNSLKVDENEDAATTDPSKAKSRKDMSWTSKLYKKSKEYKNTGNRLRDYQKDGLNWMLRCWYEKKSSILADEMGLGKTVQVVTFLEHLFEVENLRGPFLVCVPLSTIGHWRREFEGWSKMVVNTYHDTGGGRDMRDIIREFEWYYKGRSRRLLKFQTMICTYDDLIRDYEELADIPWRAVVVDEAHRLRNTNSKLLECIRTVLAKGLNSYGYQHRLLLTGTPLQNNTTELWSLLNFIEPAKFPDVEKFSVRFGNIQTQDQVEGLQRRIAPHLLRRVKEDVAKDIPPKEETIIDVELTSIQKQYYRAIYEHNHGFLMQQMKGNMPKLMNIQMELRKCCNHPYLVNGVAEMEEINLESKMQDEAALNGEVLGDNPKIGAKKFNVNKERKVLTANDKIYLKRRMEENIIPTSGKMVLLDKLLPKLKSEGHKVLIFSQMVRMLDIIGEFCEFRGYKNERLDGRVSGNERQKGIDRFNKDPDSFLFLLSTRAGGVGINLTAADTVIIFDSDWNPQNDVQAMARCHRIGQSKHVTIYRLITRRSFEAEMFDRASRKLGLEQAVLGTRKFDVDGAEDARDDKKVDAKEMELLLKEGAYAVLLDDAEADEEMREFCEQDIDKILASRAHVHITDGGQKTESWLNKKRKTRTRKTKFVDEDAEHADLDINDPDFWKKVLPDLVTPDSLLNQLESIDDEGGFNKKQFFKDLGSMIEGMLDLNRRGQLPDRERLICADLLLRVTLNEAVFSSSDRAQAQDWLTVIEGQRVRKARIDLNPGRKSATATAVETTTGSDDGVYDNFSDSDSEIPPEEDDDSDEQKRKRRRGPRGGSDRRSSGGAGSRGGRGPSKKPVELDEHGNPKPREKRRYRRKSQYDADGNLIPSARVERSDKGVPRGAYKERDPNLPASGPGSRGGKRIPRDPSAPPRKRGPKPKSASSGIEREAAVKRASERSAGSGDSGEEMVQPSATTARSQGMLAAEAAKILKQSIIDAAKSDEDRDGSGSDASAEDPYSGQVEYL